MSTYLLEEVIKHATLANLDNELSSMVVLMVTKEGVPETHMAIGPNDYAALNVSIDMLKYEMLKLIRRQFEEGGKRE